jgi:hypothetical protein
MHLQMLTLDRMSCFVICFPCWVWHNTIRPISQLLISPLIRYNTIPSCQSYTLRPRMYCHTSPSHPIRQLTRAFLISQQVVPYRICDGTLKDRWGDRREVVNMSLIKFFNKKPTYVPCSKPQIKPLNKSGEKY